MFWGAYYGSCTDKFGGVFGSLIVRKEKIID
jgi:uncharacterized glyoxalase superfamily protein PhnB